MISNPIKNRVLLNSTYKIIFYSDTNHTSRGLYINFKLDKVRITRYYKKIKCFFGKETNKNIINNLLKIEKDILKIDSHDKPKFKLKEQIQRGFLKINNNEFNEDLEDLIFVMKISGIWNNKKNSGLTFRFFIFNHGENLGFP